MAYTGTFLVKTVVGDKRMNIIRVTASATEENIDTAMDLVEGFMIAPQSCSTSTTLYPVIKMNVDSSGTAAYGYLGVSNIVATDVWIMTVIGR